MKKTLWSLKRLTYLFRRYNARYWNGRLSKYTCALGKLNKALGYCDYRSQLITVDISAHKNDGDIRSTLLHEMAHAAAGHEKLTHGYRFWHEIEALLQQKAPITIGFPETGGHSFAGDVIPRRFPLARAAMNRLQARENRKISRLATAGAFDGEFTIDREDVIDRFGEAGRLRWSDALLIVGLEFGLLDVGGKPKSRWAAEAIKAGKNAHTRARRVWLQYSRRSAARNMVATTI